MYVVTKEGKKLPVDDSSIDYDNDYVSCQETVGLYSDATILRPVWILELNTIRDKNGFRPTSKKDFSLTFVKDIKFDHEPTKEEILWAMSANGLILEDIVLIRKGYELDVEYDED